MPFAFEPDEDGSFQGKTIDRERGERLTFPASENHWHMSPWGVGQVEDLEGGWRFRFVYKTIHTPTADPEKFDCETVIVQWKQSAKALATDTDYLARVGDYLASGLVGKTNVARSRWRAAPELEREYLAHNPG